MNKKLVVFISFSQVMAREIAVFFYLSKLIPDLLEHSVIVCCKLVYFISSRKQLNVLQPIASSFVQTLNQVTTRSSRQGIKIGNCKTKAIQSMLYFNLIKLEFNRTHTDADVSRNMLLDIAVLQKSKTLEKCPEGVFFLIKMSSRLEAYFSIFSYFRFLYTYFLEKLVMATDY